MSELYDTLRQLIRHELATLRFAETGTVQAVYPAAPRAYSADVVLRGTELLLRSVPVLTPRKGHASLPEIGDLVLVQFVGGALNRPVVTGTLYNDDDAPPDNQENDWVLQLPSGADNASAGVRVEIRQSSPPGLSVSMLGERFRLDVQDDDPVLQLQVADTRISVDSGGSVHISTAGDLELKSGGRLKLSAAGDAELEASGNLVLKGTTVKIN
jgi:phage baseplate assembly protein gpV